MSNREEAGCRVCVTGPCLQGQGELCGGCAGFEHKAEAPQGSDPQYTASQRDKAKEAAPAPGEATFLSLIYGIVA